MELPLTTCKLANENFTQSEFKNSSTDRPYNNNNNNVSVDVIRFIKKFSPIIMCAGGRENGCKSLITDVNLLCLLSPFKVT